MLGRYRPVWGEHHLGREPVRTKTPKIAMFWGLFNTVLSFHGNRRLP